MSESWESKNLGDICYVLDSQRKPITKGKRVPGDIPYYGASGIVDYVEGHIFDEELLLVSEDGANLLARKYPIAFAVSGKSWVNNHAHVLRFDSRITQCFVEYYLNSISLEDYISGMAQPKLNQTKLNSISIPLPSIEKQEEIVNFLNKVLGLINDAKVHIETNIVNIEDLFKSELNQIFETKSEGWKQSRFGEVFKLKSGSGLTAKNIVSGDYPVYGGNGIVGYHDEYNLDSPTVVIGRVGACCGNVRFVEERFWLTDNAFRISNSLEGFDMKFLTYMLNFLNLRAYARQAAQPVISNSSLKGVTISYPSSLNKQIEVRNHIEELENCKLELKGIYSKKLTQLDELKRSITQKLFAGDLS